VNAKPGPKPKPKPKFRLLPGGHGPVQPEARCQVAAQVVMAGHQDYRVTAGNAQVTGRGHGVITLRVGRVLIYLEDREAFESWTRAVREATSLLEGAFGPEMPPVRTAGHAETA
jgi:hypothetical protein